MGDISEALKRAKSDPRRTKSIKPTEDVDPESVRSARRPKQATDLSNALASEREPSTIASATRPAPAPDLLPGDPQPSAATSPATREPEPIAPVERLTISRDKSGSWIQRMVLVSQKGGAAEAYRHFALRVRRELDNRGQKSLMIVSALRLEGKTTTSCNLALALSSMAGGRRTALVDLDLRRPSLGRAFNVYPEQGIESVLYGNSSLAEACVSTDLLSLDLFPVGRPVPNPHELLAGPPLVNLMRDLHASYDMVVIDSPPILLVPDTGLILPHAGSCVAVLRARQTRRESFKQMLSMLPPDKLIGTFLNDAHLPSHSKEYGYYLGEDERARPEPA